MVQYLKYFQAIHVSGAREHVAVMFITAGLLFNMMNPSFSHPCSSRLKEGKVHDGQIVVQCIEYNKLRYINVIGTATYPLTVIQLAIYNTSLKYVLSVTEVQIFIQHVCTSYK